MPTVARRKPSLEGRGREQRNSGLRELGLRLATVAACRPDRKSGRGKREKANSKKAEEPGEKAGSGKLMEKARTVGREKRGAGGAECRRFLLISRIRITSALKAPLVPNKTNTLNNVYEKNLIVNDFDSRNPVRRGGPGAGKARKLARHRQNDLADRGGRHPAPGMRRGLAHLRHGRGQERPYPYLLLL